MTLLFGIAIILVLGIGAQWLAWKLRLPSILLLLLAGFVAGPATGLIGPDMLQGDWVNPFVSLSIGIILFEGGLSLRLSELRDVGPSVRNLITAGVLTTWLLAAAAAYFILGFNPALALLTGAILTVTGPTVVVPLLRQVRPKGRVSAIAKWEGITIDPIGAVLAVLVMEVILLIHEPGASAGVSTAALHVAEGLLTEIVVSSVIAGVSVVLLVVTLRRRLVPDFLRNPVTLTLVVLAFVVAESLQHEAGLLTTTLMGAVLANQSYVSVQRIVEFKENLQVLLIGALFIILSARLDLSALQYLDATTLAFLAILIVLVRPAAVFVSSLGTDMGWREGAFLSWLAPRGIVAAAVASLFAYQLRDIFPEQVGALVPVVFIVIFGTVAVYGLTAAPLARWLSLADPNPQGVLFIGATGWVRNLARSIQAFGHNVFLIDDNAERVRRAEAEGLPARRADALSESILDELDLSGSGEIDLGGIGHLLITIPNQEVGALAALHFSEVFDSSDIYQLPASSSTLRPTEGQMPEYLQGRPLFGEDILYDDLSTRFDRGEKLRVVELSTAINFDTLKEVYGDQFVPLFLSRGDELKIFAENNPWTPRPGDQLLILVDPAAETPSVLDSATSLLDEYTATPAEVAEEE